MKKVIPGVICFFLLIASCETPESLVFKGNPGLYVPLGSPFASLPAEKRLENLISSDNIKKMLNGSSSEAGIGKELTIYEVTQDLAVLLGLDPEVQTYLARYPLAEMPLDLKQYTDRAMAAINEKQQFTMPDVPATTFLTDTRPIYLTEDSPKREGEAGFDNPFIKIPLEDMAKLVKWVEAESGGIFGLEVDYDLQLFQYLELKIPGLDFDWMKGIPTDDSGNPSSSPTKLRYYNPSKNYFYPRANGSNPSDLTAGGDLLIYARIIGPFQERPYEPTIIFDWENAKIDTETGTDNHGSFTGEYPIDNNLSEFLGDGVSIKQVDGYIYMSGGKIDESTMTLTIVDSDDHPVHEETHPLDDVDTPVFPDDGIFTAGNGNILIDPTKMSLKDDEKLDLKYILKPGSKKLKVAVKIEEVDINKADVDLDQAIQFELLILIPLDLEVTNPAPVVTTDKGIDIGNDYVMLDLGDMLSNNSDGDLFNRKEGDNTLNDFKYIKIGLKLSDSDINIIDPAMLAILVRTKDGSDLLEFKDNESLMFTGDILKKIPFSPEFKVLLKKDAPGPGGSGTFKIKRQSYPKFDFKLYVVAKAALEYTLDLNKDKDKE